jgi:2-haloacid dehalogenase
MGHYADFWKVTQDALDFALDTYRLDNSELREDLMAAYLQLDCYSEVPEALSRLKASGFKNAVLSNGTPAMLESAVKRSGLSEWIEHIFSVDEVLIFKPDPRVYQIAVDGLNLKPKEIVFQSSNVWDASGASAFGFKVAMINRFGQREERLPGKPNVEIKSLTELPRLLKFT